MTDPAKDPEGQSPAHPQDGAREPSFGNMSDAHWSRSRADLNAEALEYYRQRSHAPGVESGGAERNFYCMQCDGVIAFDHAGASCPHCGASLAGAAKRYFNWVEINEPASSDFKALVPFLIGGFVILALILAAVLWMFS
jgi:hypothetical protein